ncbi:MAG TPA: transglutaminase-like domain-containing protein [Steroidobacteraceae bacterium]
MLETLLLGGWVFELAAGRHAQALTSVQAALQSWIELGLPYRRSTSGERLYDPVEVINFQKWAGLQGLDRFWIDRYVATGRRLVGDWAQRRLMDASAPDGVGEAHFRVLLQRRFNVQSFAAGASLRLRMPLPLPGAYVRDLKIVPQVSSELGAKVALSDGRLEMRLTSSGEPAIDIGAEVAFIAAPRPADSTGRAGRLDADEASDYLRPIEGLVRITPRIHALANSLIGRETDSSKIVHSFWTYMIDELRSGMVHYDQVAAGAPGDWVLDSGWHDCQLGSAVFVALCRARGIAARIIGGNLLYGLAPTNHYWAEAWVDGRGWLPFDLLSWDLSAAGRDRQWRNHFAGSIDYRMVTQCLPKAFTGSMSVRLPPAWHMLQTRAGDGVEIELTGLDGSVAYRDQVTVLAGHSPSDTQGR